MTEAEFAFLQGFLGARSGYALRPEKRYLAESRLEPLLQRFGHNRPAGLIASLRAGTAPVLEEAVVEAMTTNETSFFRDKVPFEQFREVLLPRFLAARAATKRLRIWCAAASTGQEPYSLAMILDDAADLLAGWSVELLATDISSEVLHRARAGLYSQFEIQRGLPVRLLVKHFAQVGDEWQIASGLRRRVEFRRLNLIEDFRGLGRFDLVFCRNVLIYFDATTKRAVLDRIADVLAGDGALVLGAAETVLGLTEALAPDPACRGVYAKPSAAERPRLRLVASG